MESKYLLTMDVDFLDDALRRTDVHVMEFAELLYAAKLKRINNNTAGGFYQYVEEKYNVLIKRAKLLVAIYKRFVIDLYIVKSKFTPLDEQTIIMIYDYVKKYKDIPAASVASIVNYALNHGLHDVRNKLEKVVASIETESKELSKMDLIVQQQEDRVSVNYNVPKNKYRLFASFMMANVDDASMDKVNTRYRKFLSSVNSEERQDVEVSDV